MGAMPGTTICGLADGNNWAIRTIMNKYPAEFEARVKRSYVQVGLRWGLGQNNGSTSKIALTVSLAFMGGRSILAGCVVLRGNCLCALCWSLNFCA